MISKLWGRHLTAPGRWTALRALKDCCMRLMKQIEQFGVSATATK
jgi:hypothetical protein